MTPRFSDLMILLLLSVHVISACDSKAEMDETLLGLGPQFDGQALSMIAYEGIALAMPEGVILASATKINDNGTIIGFGVTSTGTVGIRWDRFTNPEILDGFPTPSGLNNRGEIIGGSKLRMRSGQIRELSPLPGGSEAFASDINNRGDVAGWSRNSNGEMRPVLWRHGQYIVDLGTLPGSSEGIAHAINDRGDIIGRVFIEGTNTRLPVLWTGPGDIIEIANPNNFAFVLRMRAMNSRREFVGGPPIWELGSVQLGIIDLGVTGALTDINESGIVVGHTDEIGSTGAQYFHFSDPGNVFQLPRGPDPDDVCTLFTAQGVNNRGDIVGDCDALRPYLWQRKIGPR